MLSTIQLYYEASLETTEIGNIRPYGMLPAEFESFELSRSKQ